MKFVWRPDLLAEAVRQVVLLLVLFGIIHWTDAQMAGSMMALSAVLAWVTVSMSIPVSTVERAGTSATQIQAAADANTAAGTPGGTGAPNMPGGAGGPGAPAGLGNFSDKHQRGTGAGLLLLMLLPGLALAGCGRKPLMLVAQTGQGLSGAIVQAQQATKALTDGGVLTPQQARPIQVKLGEAADAMVPLPDLLLAIDAATKAGQTDAQRMASALDILRAVGVKLDDVISGLPVVETASQVLKAVSEARKLQQQIAEALARHRTGAALDLFRRGITPPAALAN